MATYLVTRQHIKPDNDFHAAMCAVTSPLVQGDFQEAKNVMAEMVVKSETAENALPFLRGLVAVQGPVEILGAYGAKWTGSTWTQGDIRWTIRQVK